MAKVFNVTGTCIPARHYMADTSEKLRQVMALIENGAYFAINRPRQYGKTTTLFLLASQLNAGETYRALRISFAGIGDLPFEREQAFCPVFIQLLSKSAKDAELKEWLRQQAETVPHFAALSDMITALAERAGCRLVLLIDEVDKSSNNQLFISFLGILRDKYLAQLEGEDQTFHSVILAGVHDVKTLKGKIRSDEEAKYNSPWNIATDYEVSMSLQPHEIAPMLEDYAQEHGTVLDAPALAERLFYYTSGYPFLVSALCKIVDEQLLAKRDDNTWHLADVDEAARRLIDSTRSNTNFDSLIKNLENHPELYDLVHALLVGGQSYPFNVHHPGMRLGVLFGILRNGDGLKVHNRIYAELIYNYMSVKMLTGMEVEQYTSQTSYLLPGNGLNVELLLSNFQAYMKEEHSSKDWAFLERNGRLVFLAFVKPILNGKGHTFKEPQISQEKRLDVTITFLEHKYIVELKIWRGPKQHEEGLAQLANYLDAQGLAEGYLVIFDPHCVKTIHESSQADQEWIEVDGKRVFAIWV